MPFSPELLTTFLVLEPDSLAPVGRVLPPAAARPARRGRHGGGPAEARLAQLMTEDRHHATVGSRQRRRLKASGGSSSSSTHATASSSTQTSTSSSGNSSTHAEASGLRHDDHRDWLSGRAQTSDAPCSERSSQEMQHAVESQIPIKRAPKRARFSTREGLCVYRLVDDMNTPHQIISHWLVEQALLGRQSMKMLKLRPLFPPTANRTRWTCRLLRRYHCMTASSLCGRRTTLTPCWTSSRAPAAPRSTVGSTTRTFAP